MIILLTVASIFTNIFTIITVFMFWKGECESKNRTKKDNSKCLKYTLTIFMVLLMVTIIVYNILDLYLDVPFDETRKETETPIKKAKQLLSTQDYFSKFQNSTDMMSVHMDNVIETYKVKLRLKEVLKKEEEFEIMFSVLERLRQFIKSCMDQTQTHVVDYCKIRRWGEVSTLENVGNMKNTLSTNIRNAETTLERIREMLNNQTIEQQRLDVTKNATETRLRTIDKILEHFLSNINQMETTRQDWSSNTLSLFRARTNVRIIVNITIAILLILTILSILVVVKPKFLAPKMPLIAFYTTGALSLSIGFVIMLMSFRIIGSFDCPLTKDNFGLSNFTKPFPLPTGNVSFICDNIDSTFFSVLKAIPSNWIYYSRKISEEYKEKIMQSTDLTIDVPAGLLPQFNSFRFDHNCASICSGSDNANYSMYCPPTRDLLVGGIEWIAVVGGFNAARNSFGSILDEQNNKTISLFQESINDINAKFNAIDFSCQPIVVSFIKTMLLTTCQQFEVETFLIYLVWTLLACLISLILHIIVHGNVKSSNKNVDNDEQVGQSTQSPISTTTIDTKSVTPK